MAIESDEPMKFEDHYLLWRNAQLIVPTLFAVAAGVCLWLGFGFGASLIVGLAAAMLIPLTFAICSALKNR